MMRSVHVKYMNYINKKTRVTENVRLTLKVFPACWPLAPQLKFRQDAVDQGDLSSRRSLLLLSLSPSTSPSLLSSPAARMRDKD